MITVLVAWVAVTVLAGPTGPRQLDDWPTVSIRIGDVELAVVEAVDTAQGLSSIDDLGLHGGMLFAYPVAQDPDQRRFHMTDVRIPLDALFFDADGRLIESIRMPLCTATPCPRYAPSEPFRWVVEIPAGSVEVAPGAILDIGTGVL